MFAGIMPWPGAESLGADSSLEPLYYQDFCLSNKSLKLLILTLSPFHSLFKIIFVYKFTDQNETTYIDITFCHMVLKLQILSYNQFVLLQDVHFNNRTIAKGQIWVLYTHSLYFQDRLEEKIAY